MKKISDVFKNDDWKTEKHVPVIEAPETVKPNEYFQVTVSVGKEIPHPNTVPHHIRWISLYFLPEGSSVPVQVSFSEFTAHGDQAPDDDAKGVYTGSCAVAKLKIDGSGTLMASSYCNIHGLWQSSTAISCA
ncbi:MAG: superoxide reductase [Verrucomicrobiota bacterium]|jgi:superoxide reductase|nr:superoxide reductase [Verrucomicrobiota bacterium]MDK2962706.1 superoxide reductase [Verrucomicrobiota bacterium]